MKRNFEIKDGIYIKIDTKEYDLHNDYDFKVVNYSIEERILTLAWKRSSGEWVSHDLPASLTVTFSEVSEFRFMPRDKELPFTEDDCLNSFGYWVDEEWAQGVMILSDGQEPEASWLTALDFMSGAIITVQSKLAKLEIQA